MYFELHCKSNFSFQQAASHAHELVGQAADLGYAGMAITDVNTLAGIVRAHGAAKDLQLKLVIGAEIQLADDSRVVLWAADRAAYGRLSRLITCGRRRVEKGECSLTFDDIAQHHEGLLAGVVDPEDPMLLHEVEQEKLRQEKLRQDGQRGVSAARQVDRAGRQADKDRQVSRFRELFGDRCYLLGHLHRGVDDRQRMAQLLSRSERTAVPLVAAGDVRYHSPARLPLFDVVSAIRQTCSVAEIQEQLLPNAQWHLRSLPELQALWRECPGALQRTLEVASRCDFSLDELRYEYPEELAPDGSTPLKYLRKLTVEGAVGRYPAGVPAKVQGLIDYELNLIGELQYEAYFLTVWDLVRFARSRNILCQGRGSAANSAVCFCLGITAVDPVQADVLFERFLSRERNEAPDIDVDFEHERREEVLQYIYEKYGRERAGMTAVAITYRSRSAIRDVGKALGMSLDRVDALAKNADGYRDSSNFSDRCREVGIDPDSETGARLVHLVAELIGFPRHLSQHVGGMVITHGPLCELVPIENAAMDGRTVIQWNKDDLDELGVLKVDCLSLGMLTAIRKCMQMIQQHDNREYCLATIPTEDPAVYDMICKADTIGVFQIESRAQMSMLPRLRPRCFYDLVIEVAIVRPGPIQGQMVHPYLRRRAGEEEAVYPNDEIRDVLHKTLGVPIFQEQAMRLAVVAAGFTPGEADELRRAMGAWRRPGIIDQFHQKLVAGMLKNGLDETFAEVVFRQIRGFGEYGFPESHAASFAKLVYVSAWLKHYYPAMFAASLINSQPMGFYAPSQLIRDARDHGVAVRPIDVNHSDWDCTLEMAEPAEQKGKMASPPSPWAVRLGFRMIAGFSRTAAERIEQVRADGGLFESLDQFTRRTELSQTVTRQLSEADAFQSMNRSRRHALWESLLEPLKREAMPLFADVDDSADVEELAVVEKALPEMLPQEEVEADYRTAGLSLKAHPLSFYRNLMNELEVLTSERLSEVPNGRPVKVAGLVLLRQRPSTAKGITFVTLEDETGTVNLVVKQNVWDRFRQVARHSSAWLVHGRLQTKDTVIHVVVDRLEDLSSKLKLVAVKSRDFQ
ncbi:MAG: error-prone DNA polymerase [Pirellulaceae bacterium]|jgi:error-prone DNA polymerase